MSTFAIELKEQFLEKADMIKREINSLVHQAYAIQKVLFKYNDFDLDDVSFDVLTATKENGPDGKIIRKQGRYYSEELTFNKSGELTNLRENIINLLFRSGCIRDDDDNELIFSISVYGYTFIDCGEILIPKKLDVKYVNIYSLTFNSETNSYIYDQEDDAIYFFEPDKLYSILVKRCDIALNIAREQGFKGMVKLIKKLQKEYRKSFLNEIADI